MANRKLAQPGSPQPSRLKSSLLGYGVALLSVGLALGGGLLFRTWIQPTPTTLFFVAVMVSAWYGGLGPGLVATTLSTAAISYYFLPPYYAVKSIEAGSILRLGVFVAASLLISWLNESRRSAIHREQRLRAISEAAQREAQTAKERLEAVLLSINDSLYGLDRHGRFTYVNQRLCQLLGKDRQEVLGQIAWECLPGAADLGLERQFRQVLREQATIQFVCFYPSWGRWYEHRAYPSPEGVTVFGADISDRIRDEEDRKQAAVALSQSEARFRRIFECNMVPMGTWSRAGTIIHANDALLELIGYTRRELEAGEISWQALTPAEWALQDQAALAEIAEGSVISPFEKEYIHKQGHRIPVLAGGASFGDDLNSGVFFAIDLSDRKRTEAALRQSEERLRVALQNAPIMVFNQDLELRYTWLHNPVLFSLTNLLGKCDWDFLPPADAAVLTNLKQYVLKTGQSIREEIKITHSGDHYYDLTIEPLRDASNAVVGITCAAIDISPIKQTEINLRESEERLRLAMTAAQMATWDVDLSTGRALWSELHFTVLGYDPVLTGEASEAMWVNSIYPADRERVLREWRQARQERRLFRVEYRVVRADNQQVAWLTGLGNFIYDQTGQAVRASGVLFDITERKQAELMLVEQKRVLEMIATGRPLEECLRVICLSVARLNPPTRACILICDPQRQSFSSVVAPDFEASFVQGLAGATLREQAVGTCAAAAYRGEAVTCADIAADPQWAPEWRQLALSYGVLACHSTPVLGVDGRSLGSLMLCFGEARQPTDWEYRLADFGTQIANLVFERDRTHLALRESEARFRGVVESDMMGIFFWNASGCITDANDKAVRMLGYSLAELRSGEVCWSDITPPEFHATDAVMQAQIMAEGACTPFEKAYVHKDGTHIPVLIGGALLPGSSDCGVAYFVDISERVQAEHERKAAESALAANEARLRGFVESNVVGILYGDIYGSVHEANDELLRLVGYSREDLLAGRLRWTEITPPEYLPLDDQAIAEARAHGACTPYEKEYIRKDGSRVPVLIGYSLLGKHREESVAFILDISERVRVENERRQAEENLRLSENRYRTLANAVSQLMWVNDHQGNVQLYNQQWQTYTGKTTLELGVGLWADVIHPDDFAPTSATRRAAIGAGVAYEVECRLKRFDQTYRWHMARVVPFKDEQGQILSWFGTATDIHDRKCAEAERERILEREQAAREAAETANRIKDEFLAVVSHELRSPLNPILGWSRLLLNGKLEPTRAQQGLATIERNAKLQAELIEDLLDVSRILRGKLNLTISPTNLAAIIRAAIETVHLSAEAKAIRIVTQIDPAVGLVSGDATRLQQVVWNLLSNAVKFTPVGGQVTVRLEHLPAVEEARTEAQQPESDERQPAAPSPPLSPSAPLLPCPRYAQITVSDTGKGISPDFLPYVFDYFRQADSTTTRQFGGLGLGLAIVHHLVELHGGTIEADSPGEGQGATFTVKLPLLGRSPERYPSSDPTTPASHSLASPLSRLRVLVVDDDDDTRDFVAFLLEQAGARVMPCVSALAALQAFPQFLPDVVVSDIGMPEADGYSLIRQIRALPPDQGGQTPAIALTAYAGELDQQQALQAGFQRHLAKPVEPEALLQLIAALARPH